MKELACKKTSKSGNFIIYVFRDHKINRTWISIYANKLGPEETVVLENWKTFTLGTKKKKISTKETSNEFENLQDVHFETVMNFKYIPFSKNHKHARHFKYLLPGDKQDIRTNIFKEGKLRETIEINWNEKGKNSSNKNSAISDYNAQL